MSPSQRPLSLECFRVDEIINIGAGVVALFFQRGVLAVVGLEETKGAPLTTSVAQFIDGAVDFIVASNFQAFATPPLHRTSAWPETVFGPVVSTSASPTVAILLWAVEGEVKLQLTSEAELPILVLLGPPGLVRLLLLPPLHLPS